MKSSRKRLLSVVLALSMTVQPFSASVSAVAAPAEKAQNEAEQVLNRVQDMEAVDEKESGSVYGWVEMPDKEPAVYDVESVELDYPEWVDQDEFGHIGKMGGSIPIPEDYYTSTVDDTLTPDLIDKLQNGEMSAEALEEGEEIINAEGEIIPLAYPSSYNDVSTIKNYLSSALPATRNQNDYGSCWAHSTVGAAEAYMINQQSASSSVTDYSERHLAYYTYGDNRTVQSDSIEEENPCGDIQTLYGTYANEEEKEKSLLDDGGNVWHGILNLTRWRGLAKESTAKYPTSGSEALTSVNWGHNVEYSNTVRLKNAYKINITGNSSLLKRYIKAYGGVTVSYHAPDTEKGESRSTYYNSTHNSYYYTGSSTSTNHAVMIVGWDDSFPRTYFNTYPSADGAWLIRNSYKVGGTTPEMSYENYFWMSYEDPLLQNGVSHAIQIQDDDEQSDNNYHYNDVIHNSGWYTGSLLGAANCFTISGGTGKELLSEVTFLVNSFSTNGEHPYKIGIYRNLDDNGNPSSGELVHEQEGNIELGGYYTIPLTKSIVLDENERFAVEVVLDDGARTVDYETDFPGGTGWNVSTNVGYGDTGQSYLKSWTTYTDMVDKGLDNFCIGAHTIGICDITNTSLSNDKENITIKWDSVPGASYVLARNTTENGQYTIVYDGTATQYTDTAENIGGYYYAVYRKIGGNIITDTMSIPVYIAEDGNTPTKHLTANDFRVNTANAQGSYNGVERNVSVTKPTDYLGVVTVSYQKIADSEGTALTGQTISTSLPVDAGTYQVYVDASGAGDYFPAASLTDESWVFTITPLEFDEEEVAVDGVFDEVYDGQIKFRNTELYYGNTLLTEKQDYKILYYPHTEDEDDRTLIDAGTVRFRYEGMGNYTGFVEFDLEIKPAVIYVTPKDGASKTEGFDDAEIKYTADYSNVVNTETPLLKGALSWSGAGTANGDKPGYYDITVGTLAPADNPASVSGSASDFTASNYTVEVTGNKKLRIYEAIKDDYIELDEDALEYNGEYQSPAFSVWSGNNELIEGEDYEAEIEPAKDVGDTGFITVEGIGDYRGIAEAEFTIEPIALANGDAKITEHETYIYDGTEKKPQVTVSHNGIELTDRDYTITYENNIRAGAGSAKAVVTGKGNYKGTVKDSFDIEKRLLTVSANEIFKKKGLDDPGLTFTYAGEAEGDIPVFKGSLERDAGERLGSYTINIGTLELDDGDDFTASDYEIVFEENTLTIKNDVSRTVVVYDEYGDVTDSFELSDGDTISSLTIPEKEGYVFMGWYKDPKFTQKYEDNEPVREDMELYPKLVDEASLDDHSETELKNARAATCTEDGYTGDQCCVKCGKVMTEGSVIPRTGHVSQIRGQVAATCAVPGYTGDTYCSVCGQLLGRGTQIPATGNHTWDSGVVAIAPTAQAEGRMRYTCTICGGTREEAIPAVANPGTATVSPADPSMVTDDDIEVMIERGYVPADKPDEVIYDGDDSYVSSITIPATVYINGKTYKVTGISDYAFSGNKKLKKVKLGSNIRTIGKRAFRGCTMLKSVIIPDKVERIGAGAFEKCSKLKTVYVKSKVLKSVGSGAFKNLAKGAKIKVPAGYKTRYKKIFSKKVLGKTRI